MATANLTRYTILDITSIAGDTLDETNALFTDDDGVNYTGYDSAEWLLKNNESDSDDDAVISFKTSDNTLVLQDGSFYVDAPPSKTDGKEGIYAHAMKVKTGTDEITVVKGKWYIEQRRVD